MSEATETIREAGMRSTSARREVLGVLRSANGRLTHAEVCRSLKGEHDRATVHRCLHDMADAGLAARTPGQRGETLVWEWALCAEPTALTDERRDMPRYFTKEEVSQITRSPVSTVNHWIYTGVLRSVKVGRRRLVAERDLMAFMGE